MFVSKEEIEKEGLKVMEDFVYKNGAVYMGLMKGNQRWGWGTQTWIDTTRYKGYWF
jgi:hypothetical protein